MKGELWSLVPRNTSNAPLRLKQILALLLKRQLELLEKQERRKSNEKKLEEHKRPLNLVGAAPFAKANLVLARSQVFEQ